MWIRSKKKLKYKAPELFTDTQIPVYNWEMLSSTNDIWWLLKDQNDRSRIKELPSERELELAYFAIYDEYANFTGLHEKMDKWRELMILRMEARVELAQGNRARKNNIDVYTEQIRNIMKSDGTDIVQTRMAVQQAYGQAINPKITTLKEFIMICKLLEQQNKPRENGKDRE
jgi:hypothetical protein